MIKLPFTPEMVAESKVLAESMGEIKNSITQGAGNRAGFLAELALASYLGATRADERGFDLIYKNKKIEVKTKRRTVPPLLSYEGSVALLSEHQHPDYYAFLSLTFGRKMANVYSQLDSVWFCGIIRYEDFLEKSILYKKGQVDESNGFIVLTDMRNIKYKDLKQPK